MSPSNAGERRVTDGPALFSAWISAWLAVAAWGVLVPYSTPGFLVAGAGCFLLCGGLALATPQSVSAGFATLVLGTFVAGIEGAPALVVLASVTAAILAWDVGHNAISIGTHLGRQADTIGAERAHLAASATVGLAAVSLVYGTFLLATDGRLSISLAFLILAGATLAIAFGPRDVLELPG